MGICGLRNSNDSLRRCCALLHSMGRHDKSQLENWPSSDGHYWRKQRQKHWRTNDGLRWAKGVGGECLLNSHTSRDGGDDGYQMAHSGAMDAECRMRRMMTNCLQDCSSLVLARLDDLQMASQCKEC